MGTTPKSVSRREFLATSVTAALGYSFIGMMPSRAYAGGGISKMVSGHHERHSALTRSVKDLKEHYDVLVVGSGYGGSILASRLMAHEGLSLCLLERGREWHPGEFPTEIGDVTGALKTPVNPLGLIDITAHAGSHLDIVSGCGLGGTSLINAAIASWPDKLVFEQPEWPDEIRYLAEQSTDDSGPLWDYYLRAENVLKPTIDPQINDIVKIKTFKNALHKMGQSHQALKLNVNHKSGVNAFGVQQGACVRCGDCCSGCNAGAKNTLAMNYLPMARKAGAEIFTGMEVNKIEKNAEGYLVSFTYHGKEHFKKHGTIQTKLLILSAGSQGSTEILLRSQHESALSLSSRLGSRLSANGDVLSFSYNGDHRTDVIDYGNSRHPRKDQSFRSGQALASACKYRGSANDLNDHFLLLGGPVPSAFAGVLAKALATLGAPKSLLSPAQGVRAALDLAAIYPPDAGALNHTFLMLACGHDSSGGTYVYNGDGRPKAVWPHVTEEESFKKIRAVMKDVNDQLGGVFIDNPRSQLFGGHRLQATHPLGGCPMGNTPDQGVVNHLGQVFDADGSVHEGLYVADASIIPRSLGATPLMTISALSERIADGILATMRGECLTE